MSGPLSRASHPYEVWIARSFPPFFSGALAEHARALASIFRLCCRYAVSPLPPLGIESIDRLLCRTKHSLSPPPAT